MIFPSSIFESVFHQSYKWGTGAFNYEVNCFDRKRQIDWLLKIRSSQKVQDVKHIFLLDLPADLQGECIEGIENEWTIKWLDIILKFSESSIFPTFRQGFVSNPALWQSFHPLLKLSSTCDVCLVFSLRIFGRRCKQRKQMHPILNKLRII